MLGCLSIRSQTDSCVDACGLVSCRFLKVFLAIGSLKTSKRMHIVHPRQKSKTMGWDFLYDGGNIIAIVLDLHSSLTWWYVTIRSVSRRPNP